MFPSMTEKEAWDAYSLSQDQIDFFNEYGYLADVKLLEEDQVAQLCSELAAIRNPQHSKHDLFYEFHSNQSDDPNAVLFHSLGHWRITEGFHERTLESPFCGSCEPITRKKSSTFLA